MTVKFRQSEFCTPTHQHNISTYFFTDWLYIQAITSKYENDLAGY